MGVKFDRVLDGFDGPFEELKDEVQPPKAKVDVANGDAGFLLDMPDERLVPRGQSSAGRGEDVRRLGQKPFAANGTTYPRGTFFIARKDDDAATCWKSSRPRSARRSRAPTTDAQRRSRRAEAGARRLVGPLRRLDARRLDAADARTVRVPVQGRLSARIGQGRPARKVRCDRASWMARFAAAAAASARSGPTSSAMRRPSGDAPPNASNAEANIPEEYRGRRGGITKDKTGPHLKEFLEEGGTIVAIGSSTALANQLDLPLGNSPDRQRRQGQEKPLGRDKFYVPGSVLQIRVDATNSLAWGIDEYIDVMFSSNPVFSIPEDEDAKGLKRVAWYNGKTPLRSGWAWGQEHLEGGVAIARRRSAKGDWCCAARRSSSAASRTGRLSFCSMRSWGREVK